MMRWWRDLTEAWYYFRRTINSARGKRPIIPATRTKPDEKK